MKEAFERFVLITAAAASFGLTFALALQDRSSAATVMAALTVAFLALYFLPFVESVQAFGLLIKLREKVAEADDLLSRLRSNTLAASNIMFSQLGWLGRDATPTWAEKRLWSAAIERNLRDLGVDEAIIKDLQRPFLSFASYDLFSPIDQIVGARLDHHRGRISGRIIDASKRGVQAEDPEYQALLEEIRLMSQGAERIDNPYMLPEIVTLGVLVERRIGRTGLPDDEKTQIRKYAERFVKVSDGIHNRSAISDEAQALLDEYMLNPTQWRSDYRRMFGND